MYTRLLIGILKKPLYSVIAVGASITVFSFAVWLPNLSLITKVLLSEGASWFEKITFVVTLYTSLESNFSLFSASMTILIATLFGIQMALLVYYIKRARLGGKSAGTQAVGIGGLISGLFGIGCATCGTFIAASVLALLGAGGSLAFLPLKGEEFGIIGMALLVYANYLLLKKINDPLVCSV